MSKLAWTFWIFALFVILLAIFLPDNIPNHGTTGAPTATVEVTPRLGDRIFVASVLADIFGPAGDRTIRRFILDHPGIFGGPCDPYQQAGKFRCPSGKTAYTAPIIGTPSAVRAGHTERACRALTQLPATLRHAIDKISGRDSAPNTESVQKAFSLFFPERTATPNIIKSLLGILPEERDASRRWAGIFYVLCRNPEWHII